MVSLQGRNVPSTTEFAQASRELKLRWLRGGYACYAGKWVGVRQLDHLSTVPKLAKSTGSPHSNPCSQLRL